MNGKEITTLTIQDETWLGIRQDKQAVVDRLKVMLVNGKKLHDQQVFALAAYSMTTGLNPFNGECYASEIGIIPGVQGYRRLASEQLANEAEAAGVEGTGYYQIEYVTPEPHEVNAKEGDIAWKAILTDNVTLFKWRQAVNEAAAQLRAIFPKESFFDIMGEARKQAGVTPSWWAVGVVSKEETFSGWVDYKDHSKGRQPEMWDRNERAMKRAGKAVIKKRFAGLQIPSHRYKDGWTPPYDAYEGKVVVEEPARKAVDPTQVLKELGYPESEPPNQEGYPSRPPVENFETGKAEQLQSKEADEATLLQSKEDLELLEYCEGVKVKLNRELCNIGDLSIDSLTEVIEDLDGYRGGIREAASIVREHKINRAHWEAENE